MKIMLNHGGEAAGMGSAVKGKEKPETTRARGKHYGRFANRPYVYDIWGQDTEFLRIRVMSPDLPRVNGTW